MAVQDLIRRFHQAHADHDADALRACHADSYFRWFGNGSDDPKVWTPGAYCTRDYMMEWGKSEEVNTSTYAFEVEFLSTRANDELALAVAAESGSWTKADGTSLGIWDGAVTVWFAAKIGADWKISGFYRRDAEG
ncbi:MAG: nuclear transport factor 2 family protein [Myxococcota bacterium]